MTLLMTAETLAQAPLPIKDLNVICYDGVTSDDLNETIKLLKQEMLVDKVGVVFCFSNDVIDEQMPLLLEQIKSQNVEVLCDPVTGNLNRDNKTTMKCVNDNAHKFARNCCAAGITSVGLKIAVNKVEKISTEMKDVSNDMLCGPLLTIQQACAVTQRLNRSLAA